MITRRRLLATIPVARLLRAQARPDSRPPAPGPQIYDLLLKNGQVIDPKNNRNGRFDIAIAGNKIARIAPNLPAAHARQVVEAGDYYVTPGLIDIHTHFDAGGADLNLQPDHHALTNGVTTAVDAGSSGHKNFEDFKRRTIDRARTRVLAWLNVAAAGLQNDGESLDPAACAAMAKKYAAVIVGTAASRTDAAERAVEAGRLAGTPAMVERGPDDGLLDRLRPSDIVTKSYQPGTNASDRAKAAQKRGVMFDTGSFWFRVAIPAVKEGFLPDTISTNINKESILLPRANMSTTMSKFLNMGLSLEQVIERSTVNAARAIRRPELGQLSEGGVADIAVLELQKGKFGFVDSGHAKLLGDRKLRCVLTVRNGRVVWDTEGLSLTDWQAAGPYSNFK